MAIECVIVTKCVFKMVILVLVQRIYLLFLLCLVTSPCSSLLITQIQASKSIKKNQILNICVEKVILSFEF